MTSIKSGFLRHAALACVLASTPTLAAAQSAQAAKPGVFKITYDDGDSEGTKAFAASLREAAIFDALAGGLSQTLRLPRDINGVFRNCGEINAFYDPAKREVIVCYELISTLYDTAARNSNNEAENSQFIIGATLFFFLHEVGHALVDQLELPITGKEEDAVDEIATLIMLSGDDEGGGNDGAKLVAAAAYQFRDMAATRQSMTDLVFWDEHSLDAQRMYGILCMIYGANPNANASMVGDHGLPKARADQCPADYQKRKRAWEKLLESSMTPDPAEAAAQPAS